MLVSVLASRLTSEAEYSNPLLDPSFMNGINDFDISAGHTSFMDGMNNFDISAGLHAALQPPPPLRDTSFMGEMNGFDSPTNPHSVSRLPSLGDVPSMDGMNDFDISAGVPAAPQPPLGDLFANTSDNFEISHQGVIDGSSFNHRMNDFNISAGQEDISSPMGCARFQLPVDISHSQHLVGA